MIKNKLKISLMAFAILGLSLMGVGNVNAATLDLTWSAAQTIDLSSPDMDLTIVSGSTASTFAVGTGTITPTLALGDVFTVATAAAGDFAISPTTGVIITCSSSTIATAVITAAGSQAYTITPSTTACAYSSGSGGGGYTPPADTTPPSGTSVSINAGATTSAVLSATLTLAATGASQMMISNDSAFTGATWENFSSTSKTWTLVSGDGVKTVYVKFRDPAGNASVAVSDTITVSGSGTVAPVVVLPLPPVINIIPGCGNRTTGFSSATVGLSCVGNTGTIPAVPGTVVPGCGNRTTGFSSATVGLSCVGNTPTTPATPGTTGPYKFGTTTLKNGSKGEAVKELQRFLNQILNLGLVVDGKLGPKTIKVIKQWQKDNGLKADGLIGAKTKAKMNASVK